MAQRIADPQLTANAMTVLEKRYLLKDDSGRLLETPRQLFERVAAAIAEPEGRRRRAWAERFYELMASRRFLPNSPTLMNAGRSGGQLSACFVLPVPDSLDGIFEALKEAALIHQSGGGTGFAFSRLRPAGSFVRSSAGVASGPVSFMRIFDVATETIKQGGTRRGANMGVLRVDHPDILEFIDSKRDLRSITNFNISVGATEEFMRAVRLDSAFSLRDPRDGRVVKEVRAREVFERMAIAAWECGDPGLVFLDRINLFNPTPNEGPMESTNPCGEQPLLPYESCNLGSLNLGMYFRDGGFDWKLFRADIDTAVRFLDNVVEVNTYPIEECEWITRRNRKIGLGVMGFADLLLLAGIPYGSPDSIRMGEEVMSFLDREAKHSSAKLAKDRGPFPNWRRSMWNKLGFQPMRNATVSTVAPTGTISIIAGASSGIEPVFAGVFYRNVLSGARLREVHPVIEKMLEGRELLSDEDIARVIGPVWAPAYQVALDDHVRMQAVFQRFSDSAVSKTVNLPKEASVEDISRAYLLAYELGCKGITVYRDQSRNAQVLERPMPGNDVPAGAMCPEC